LQNYLIQKLNLPKHKSGLTILLNADIFLRSFIRNYSMIMIYNWEIVNMINQPEKWSI